jgi:Protein of unknown function (DUF2442)
MAITEKELRMAQARRKRTRAKGYAIEAKYNHTTGNIDVVMSSKMYLGFPVSLVPDLTGATEAQLADIEIMSSGLGLHWPQLDVDLYVPALVLGHFGSKKLAAAQLGAAGGKVRSADKAEAARENGRLGGRPRRSVARS